MVIVNNGRSLGLDNGHCQWIVMRYGHKLSVDLLFVAFFHARLWCVGKVSGLLRRLCYDARRFDSFSGVNAMSQEETPMELAARRVVELGNEVADLDQEADLWDIADGLLAGAVHYWLYAHQPCEDPMCEDCAEVGTAELRLAELRKLLDEFARESDYFHTPNDTNVGRA